MRNFIEIIAEKSLSPAELSMNKHEGKYLQILLKLAEAGPVSVSPEYIEKFGELVSLTPETVQAIADVIAIGAKLPTAPMFMLTNGSIVKGAWGALNKTVEYTGSEKKSYNAGHLSELLMGLAVSAKFFYSGSNITVKQLITIFNMMRIDAHQGKDNKRTANVQFAMETDVVYTDIKGKADLLTFRGVIPGISAQEFIKFAQGVQFPSDLNALMASAVRYVNESETVAKSVMQVKNDPNRNTINIVSDGTSDSKLTKADLVLSIDGKKINLFSLKTYSTPTLGQISGTTFGALTEWFMTSFNLNIEKYKEHFDPELSKEKLHENVFKLYDDVIYPKVEKLVEGQKPNKESQIVKQLVRSANLHARGANLEDVEIVKLDDSVSSGGYKILKFSDSIEDAMRMLDLHSKLIKGPKGRTIQILVKPAETLRRGEIWANLLCQFRSQLMGGYLRNYYEIGDIMVDLSELKGVDTGQAVGVKDPDDSMSADAIPSRPKRNSVIKHNMIPQVNQVGREKRA